MFGHLTYAPQAAGKTNEAMLVDQDTHDGVSEGTCGFEPLPPLKVKGKVEPVTVYQPIMLLKGSEVSEVHSLQF